MEVYRGNPLYGLWPFLTKLPIALGCATDPAKVMLSQQLGTTTAGHDGAAVGAAVGAAAGLAVGAT